jgi:hypothetical protein
MYDPSQSCTLSSSEVSLILRTVFAGGILAVRFLLNPSPGATEITVSPGNIESNADAHCVARIPVHRRKQGLSTGEHV